MSELKSLSDIFEKRLFRIPDYQRGYAWQQPQLIDFWEDLNNIKGAKYHYTGLLSLKIHNEKPDFWGNDSWMVERGYKVCNIVDGQQRLTTFIILLNELVLFVRGLKENKDKSDDEIILKYERISSIVEKYILQKKPGGIITSYLFGYESDNPSDKYLRHKIFGEPYSGEVSETYYTKNLKSAKEFFKDNIKVLYENEGIEGLETIYHNLTQSLKFNLHEIDDDYDVFVAFETMNNRGKRLTNLELLKNRLIYLTTIYDDAKLDSAEKEALRKQINDAWKEVYYHLGRNKNRALSDDEFLRAHWIIYYLYTRKRGDDYIHFLLNKFSAKNVFEKLSVVEKEVEPEIVEDVSYDDEEETAESETIEVITLKLEPLEISMYVNSLKELVPYWYDSYFPYESSELSSDEQLWLDRLNRIGIGYFRPLVTVAMCKSTDSTEKIELFKAIERFVFICFRLARYRSNYNSAVYYKAARELYAGKDTIKDITKRLNDTADETVHYAIPNFTNDLEKKFKSGNGDGYYAWNSIRYFMYEYEYHLQEKAGPKKITWEMFSKTEKDKVTIEHILPQETTDYWKKQFHKYIDDPMKIRMLTGALGNLLPLSQSINSSLQNYSFEYKKHPTGEDRRGYDKGSYSELEVAAESDWDANKIHDRSMKLLDFMSSRWNVPMSKEEKEKLAFDEFVE